MKLILSLYWLLMLVILAARGEGNMSLSRDTDSEPEPSGGASTLTEKASFGTGAATAVNALCHDRYR
jgi:hypothetical protein